MFVVIPSCERSLTESRTTGYEQCKNKSARCQVKFTDSWLNFKCSLYEAIWFHHSTPELILSEVGTKTGTHKFRLYV
jgi:hypothetical protein